MSKTDNRPFYITTTLPYVNDKPHVGHALEFVQADVLARIARLQGRKVFFNTGADEHGQKIWQKSQESNQSPQDYVDYYAGELKKLEQILDLSNDSFIRTTDPKHIEAVREVWARMLAKGDIYKKTFSAPYCVSCEMFLLEKDIKDGRCSLHPEKEIEYISEENYFFAFSRYQQKLLEYLELDGVVYPEHRRQELITFVKEGLEDFSISRLREKMSWGIEVPDDPEHVIYVWFDALTNYISCLDWPKTENKGLFYDFWDNGQNIQLAGKDQLRFQSLIWQAMLMSADLPVTESVFYHGFINSNGKKMSKSVGNVIDPVRLSLHYGSDALRYYLLRHIHPFADSDLTLEKFHESYTAHLVNGLGNLTNRVLNMAEKYEVDWSFDLWSSKDYDKGEANEFFLEMQGFKFHSAMDMVFQKVTNLDKVIDAEKPFLVAKEDLTKARLMVIKYLPVLGELVFLLEPVMPKTSGLLKKALISVKKPTEPLFSRIDPLNS